MASSGPLLALAPMAGLTHAAFRELVASYGAPDLFFTEMLNVRTLVSQNPDRDPYLVRGEGDRPLVAQLVGRDPELFARAVARLEERGGFAGYDLNFGCARGAIQRYGWGVALMEEPALAGEIVAAVRASTARPVSAKIRSGRTHDRDRLLAFVEALRRAGVSMVTLHPRTAAEGFKRPPRWEEIGWLAGACDLVVLGNGDVFSPQGAARMLRETGCRGVMIGRAALLRPWIFRDVRWHLAGEPLPPPPDPVEVVTRMAELVARLLPPEIQEKRFELWLFWFLQNFPFGLHYLREVRKRKGLTAKVEALARLLSRERIGPYPARPYLHR